MTRDQIVSDVQAELGFTLSTTSRVKLAQVQDDINKAHRVAVSKMGAANINYYNGEEMKANTTANAFKYELPDKFLVMKRLQIRYADGDDMILATPMDISQIHNDLDPNGEAWSEGAPWYAIWENFFYIKPTPTESSSGWSTDAGEAMHIWFIESPADLGASEAPLIPDEYHHILAYPAIARGKRILGMFEQAREYAGFPTSLFETALREMVGENTDKDRPKVMGFSIVRGPNPNHGIRRP